MAEQREAVSVWTIAGGILLALLILRACEVWQQRQAIETFNAQVRQIMAQPAPRATPRQLQNRQPRPAAQEESAQPLGPDERCLNGQRFRRIENGWEQIGTCR